jgi:type VI secretion system protein ImpB
MEGYMTDNIYEKLNRVRKPRVHIRYDVETENGVEQHELPFVIGVMGDFSGHSTTPLPPLKRRKFISLDRDNFDQVMENMNVGLTLKVDNALDQKNGKIPIRLVFKSMRDFEPDRLIEQIEPLRKLKQARDRLVTLLNKSDQSEALEEALEKILTDNQQLQALVKQLNKKSDVS